MALGTFGSTLSDELNRLANGGTYRTMASMVDDALAAKQWANRENINPYSTDTVGILNEIAGLGLDKKNWLDFNGVCNYIAGTTGLPAAAALRQVYNTTDLLTSQSAYYVDALYPTGSSSTPGYVYLNGVAGNYLSSPDSSVLDITGDIDIRVQVAMDNWIPASNMTLLGKWGVNTTQSYLLWLRTDGKLEFAWTTTGSYSASFDVVSSITTGINNGATKWVRVTLDVDNGASGRDIKFWTSDDNITYTQLGTTTTTAGTTSIYSGSSNLTIGADDASGLTRPTAGKFYRAQVRNGIDGTIVFDANMANVSLTATSFTESSSNAATVTINGFRAYPQTADNLGTAGSLLPTTLGSSTAADSNDPKFLDFTGTNYVYLPGVASNYLSVPDAAALDITGDIDIRVKVAMDDWTPAVATRLLSKYLSTGNQRSYQFWVETDGKLSFGWSVDGTSITPPTATSSIATGVTDGSVKWVRATLDVNNGAGTPQYEVKFYTSDDGSSWTQLGSTVTGTTGVTSIYAGTSQVEIGSISVGTVSLLAGKIYRAQICNGIDGVPVLDVDTSVITAGSQTSFTAVTGQTVTINRSTSGRKTVAVTQPTWLFGTDDYMEVNNRYMASGTYLYLPGVNSNNATAPDSAALSITGDIDIRCKVAMDDWTPSTISTLVNKLGASGNRSYELYVATSGKLGYIWSSTGSTVTTKESSVATGIADGATKWVRVTHDVDNGASGNDIIFYTSDDGITWTQLGTTTTTAGTTSIYDSTASLEVGTENNAQPARGKFFRAQVLNGINGTVAFDANFETSITSLLQTSFTESSANAATVTINRSGSAYRSAGITTAGYLYPGATNTFSASATDFLNFGASDSFTFLVVHRQWDTAATTAIIGNRTIASGTVTPGYYFATTTFASGVNRVYAGISGRVTSVATTNTDPNVAWVNGVLNTHVATVNRSTNLLSLTKNAGTAATVDISGITTSSTNFDPFRIGAVTPTAGSYAAMTLNAVAVFRTALTTAQIRQISNYFANREVYL